MSVQYWPKRVGMEVNFGQISVLLESENTLNDYIHRQMKITYATVSIMLLFIVLFQVLCYYLYYCYYL